VQIVGGALRVSRCAENRALVFAQIVGIGPNFEPSD
jgi:hypothetical protein